MNKIMLRPIICTILLHFFLVSWCSAANFFVRSGASGANNGSDWTNAWNQMNKINYSLINPGDTIFIAAGTYNTLNIDKSGTAVNPITIKRATSSANGTSIGWSNTYDGQVIIDGGGSLGAINIGGGTGKNQSYLVIDGATKYGIKAMNATAIIRAVSGSLNNNITIRYVEMQSSGSGVSEDCLQGRGNNLLVEYSYLHNCDNVSTHGDGIQWFSGNNIIVRYNIFMNTGQIMMLTETAWGNEYINNLEVYYNVFYNRGGQHYNGISKKLCPQPGYYWHIYNNTFDLEATDNSGFNNLFSGAGSCTQMDFKNNAVIYSNGSSTGDISHSSNAYDNSGQYSVYNIPTETGRLVAADLGFVNASSADYHLTSSSSLIGKGVNLGLSSDFDGKPVPATPSIGAFEPGSSSTSLLPPTNLIKQ